MLVIGNLLKYTCASICVTKVIILKTPVITQPNPSFCHSASCYQISSELGIESSAAEL